MCRTKRNIGHDEAVNWPHRSSSDTPRRTALYEGDDGAEAYGVSRLLDEMNVDMTWCSGPDGAHGPRCSLVEEGHCDLMENADFVINNLGMDDPRRAAVAQAENATVAAHKPVAVVARVQEAESVQQQLRGCIVVEGPLRRDVVTDIARID